MTIRSPSVLLFGFGNPGRLDDGLGPALAAEVAVAVERGELPRVTVESNYQLSVEDGALIANHDVVIFADAHVACDDPFVFQSIVPRRQESFTSHSVRPDAVLGVAHDLFAATTHGYLLGIRGHTFNAFEEKLSEQAQSNLEAAIDFIKPLLEQEDIGRYAQVAAAYGDASVPTSEAPGVVTELTRDAHDEDAQNSDTKTQNPTAPGEP
jgi:hydrogenase maturation protease